MCAHTSKNKRSSVFPEFEELCTVFVSQQSVLNHLFFYTIVRVKLRLFWFRESARLFKVGVPNEHENNNLMINTCVKK